MPKSPDFQKPVTKAVECPFCGKTFDYSLYPEIVIPRDRKLKKKVLNKSTLQGRNKAESGMYVPG